MSNDTKGIYDRVRGVIIEVLRVEEQTIVEDARIREDLGADSLDTVSLLMALEEEFGGNISDEEAEKLATVKDVVAYIEHKAASVDAA